MRIDHFLMEELEEKSLVDKAMAILTDLQEITKELIEKQSNVLQQFEIPFKSAFEEFFEKEGKEIAEANPSYIELLKNKLLFEKIVDFSLGSKKTSRSTGVFEQALESYIEKLDEKMNGPKKASLNDSLDGIIQHPGLLTKVKDIIEFTYIYRFNQKETDKVLQFLNGVFNNKYKNQFLQSNMELYQAVEAQIDNLVNIDKKDKHLELLMKEEKIASIEFFVIFYWFYARGELSSLLIFLEAKELPENFREYIIELIIRRSDMKSKEDKIAESINQAKDLVKDIVLKLNNQEIPVISKNMFEHLLVLVVNRFPNYFNSKVTKRIRNNVYNYIKAEKVRNG